ncbi:MAG: CCA tRNA nucleotidyltransferase [Spirochaetales bacterium]|uniref:CCA tRNA nucleotidyltransferase n=1 Tax=Candidatus Thalassospirochaeta sargassi TaxID=3119039 RepID=A0AAJ1MI26_9SPIO|nr:CCA tRNA nucleotidyltransferase [Spirochaetales bacterium]
MRYKVDKALIKFSKIFRDAGFSCYLVGGAVRNLSMGLKVSDYDFATDARPEDVISLFRKVIPTGIKHGTVTVLFGTHKLEVTTFRTDGDYTDLRRPDKVHFTPSVYEDLKRRDFTINSMAYDLVTGEWLDPHNGKTDIKKKIIRAIGNPSERFQEDALRIMRGCRFACQLEFDIEESTLGGMKEKAANLSAVSAERIRDELEKILRAGKPSIAFHVMAETGVLEVVLPELAACRGVKQKGFHSYDVFEHSLYACDGAPSSNPEVRLAALLHDIGKPASLGHDESGIPTFYGHERYSVEISRKIIQRFKFPKAFEAHVLLLIENHMFNYQPEWTDSAVRRFIARTGVENLENLFSLRRADQYGMSAQRIDSTNLNDMQKRITSFLEAEHALSIRDLKINGNILIDRAGVPRGPMIGIVLEFLLETVLDDPSQNNEEKLLELAVNFYNERIKAD